MRYAIWDLETNSSDTFFGFILEAGGILVDENFKELDRFNLRGRLPEGELFQSMALLVNGTSIKQLTQVNVSKDSRNACFWVTNSIQYQS